MCPCKLFILFQILNLTVGLHARGDGRLVGDLLLGIETLGGLLTIRIRRVLNYITASAFGNLCGPLIGLVIRLIRVSVLVISLGVITRRVGYVTYGRQHRFSVIAVLTSDRQGVLEAGVCVNLLILLVGLSDLRLNEAGHAYSVREDV